MFEARNILKIHYYADHVVTGLTIKH